MKSDSLLIVLKGNKAQLHVWLFTDSQSKAAGSSVLVKEVTSVAAVKSCWTSITRKSHPSIGPATWLLSRYCSPAISQEHRVFHLPLSRMFWPPFVSKAWGRAREACSRGWGSTWPSLSSLWWSVLGFPPSSLCLVALQNSSLTKSLRLGERKLTWFGEVLPGLSPRAPPGVSTQEKYDTMLWGGSVICEITTCTSLRVSAAQRMLGEIDCKSMQKKREYDKIDV